MSVKATALQPVDERGWRSGFSNLLGAFFSSRAAVSGTAVFLLFLQIQLVQTPLGDYLPGGLPLTAAEVFVGNPLPTVVPLASSAVLTVLFIVAAFRRFGREEF